MAKIKHGNNWQREVLHGSDQNHPGLPDVIISSEPISQQGILESPNSLIERSVGFPETSEVGANSVIPFPLAVGLCTVALVWFVAGSSCPPIPSTQMPRKACFLRPVTLPSSPFAYMHLSVQLPTAIKKEVTRVWASVQQSPNMSTKANLFRETRVRILPRHLRY